MAIFKWVTLRGLAPQTCSLKPAFLTPEAVEAPKVFCHIVILKTKPLKKITVP